MPRRHGLVARRRIELGELVRAISMLRDAGIEVRSTSGLPTGLLVVDDEGYIFTPVTLYLESDRRIALCVECSCVRDMLAALSYVARVRQRVAAGVEVVRQVSPRYPPCRLGTVIF